MVKAIFLDIDGTLRNESTGIPKSAVRAVLMSRKKGIAVFLCTGRNMASIQPDVRSIKVDGIIAGGGCFILDGDLVLKDSCFQNKEIEKLLVKLNEWGLPFALESRQKIFMNQDAAGWLEKDFEEKVRGLEPEERIRQKEENGICYKENLGEYKEEQDAIHKICIWSPPERPLKLQAMAAEFGTVVQQTVVSTGGLAGWQYMELQPKGCTKGEAIRELCIYRHMKPADTMSFGDGKNDIDMLQVTGVGVAMADGDEELKQYADAVCEPAGDNGIYKELVRRRVIEQEEGK